MRAAIYARYSSDLQSAASIDDQVRLCRSLCADNGWTVVDVFTDEAMSGASHLRPGFQHLQNAAIKGEVDVMSYGADGKPGGEGNNADLGSWQ